MIRTLALDDITSQVRDSVSRRLADGLAATSSAPSEHAIAWAALAELGALGVLLPESEGGLGGGISSAVAVLEPLGRHGVLVPFLDGLCVPAAISGRVSNSAGLRDRLATAFNGGAPVVLAWAEPGVGWSRAPLLTRAEPVSGGWVLSGFKAAVRWAAEASAIVLSAAVENGVGLFLVPADAQGLSILPYATADGGRAADLRFESLQLSKDARLDDGNGAEALGFALDTGAALSLAEAVGAMDACLDMTIGYLGAREQFGTPLSRSQALQHRLVDAYALCETAWSMAHDAASALTEDVTVAEREMRISSAKAHAGPAGRRVGQEMLQLHGAIGMTMDYPLGRRLARLTLLDLGFGDADWHLARVVRLLGEAE